MPCPCRTPGCWSRAKYRHVHIKLLEFRPKLLRFILQTDKLHAMLDVTDATVLGAPDLADVRGVGVDAQRA